MMYPAELEIIDTTENNTSASYYDFLLSRGTRVTVTSLYDKPDDFNFDITSKIEKVPRGIRGEKSSKDMASSRNLVSTIGALASPKMGDGTRCPEG